MTQESGFKMAYCRICGQPFEIPVGKRGRPSEYDTENCRETAQRLAQLHRLLSWLRTEHGFETRADLDSLHGEVFAMANALNPRHKNAKVLT